MITIKLTKTVLGNRKSLAVNFPGTCAGDGKSTRSHFLCLFIFCEPMGTSLVPGLCLPEAHHQHDENCYENLFHITVPVCCQATIYRDDSRFAPSQWETSLQSNAVSHWLDANLESSLIQVAGVGLKALIQYKDVVYYQLIGFLIVEINLQLQCLSLCSGHNVFNNSKVIL